MIQKQERGPHALSRGNLCNGVTCCNLCYKLLRSFFLPSPYSISLSYNLSRADSPANSRTQARATLWKALDVSKWSVYLRENIPPLGGSDVRKETQESRIHVWPSLWTTVYPLSCFFLHHTLSLFQLRLKPSNVPAPNRHCIWTSVAPAGPFRLKLLTKFDC